LSDEGASLDGFSQLSVSFSSEASASWRIDFFAYFLWQDNWSEAEIADTKINKLFGGKT